MHDHSISVAVILNRIPLIDAPSPGVEETTRLGQDLNSHTIKVLPLTNVLSITVGDDPEGK
jgi:hypothetical protein